MIAQKSTILHIEDDECIKMALGLALNDEGYKVFTAKNGKEALEFLALKSTEIDIILLDVMMPVMDGFTFYNEKLHNESIAKIPTIIYSADDRNKSKVAALGLPYISKPFNLTDIFEGIEKNVRK